MRLPPWVVDERESVRREVEPYRDATPAERLADLRMLCRDAVRLLDTRGDAARILAHRDPLPASSRRALARLRQGRPPR